MAVMMRFSRAFACAHPPHTPQARMCQPTPQYMCHSRTAPAAPFFYRLGAARITSHAGQRAPYTAQQPVPWIIHQPDARPAEAMQKRAGAPCRRGFRSAVCTGRFYPVQKLRIPAAVRMPGTISMMLNLVFCASSWASSVLFRASRWAAKTTFGPPSAVLRVSSLDPSRDSKRTMIFSAALLRISGTTVTASSADSPAFLRSRKRRFSSGGRRSAL